MTKSKDKENVVFNKSPGSTVTLVTPQVKRKIQREFTGHPSITGAALAQKVKLSPQYTSIIKVRELGIKARVKQRAPKYEGDQEERATAGPKKNGRKMRRKVIITDDEEYDPVVPADVSERPFLNSVDP